MNTVIKQLSRSTAADRRWQITADVMGSGSVSLYADSAYQAIDRCHTFAALRGEPMT
ncbi:MAG: hypothetical protein AAF290_11890 [Pseudomonadota bacterium]